MSAHRDHRRIVQPHSARVSGKGFTLIELLVVLAVMALLAGLVVPRYLDRVEDAREVVLKQNLIGLRVAIDQFYRDRAQYPENLSDLVTARYIRDLPIDPVTQRADTWTLVSPSGAIRTATSPALGSIFDVKSGAQGNSKDGSPYASW